MYKKGAFVAGQLSMVVRVGKRAEEMLRNGEYSSEEERKRLEVEVATGKSFEKTLEKHREKMGL